MKWGVKVLVALMLVFCLGAENALAAPPNDNFENREVLPSGFPGGLPIEVKRSNVEATAQPDEELTFMAAGHSIWFEWEATSTGWTTIGTCSSAFPTVSRVFTGAALGALDPAATGNEAEGPECMYEDRQYTFMATSGTDYVIGVDGNGFYVPPAPPPVTEGQVVLRIEPTPPPPNDDFSDALTLDSSIGEEPGGTRFYDAHTFGYNWSATTEPGEFPYGTNSGASVWYRWTPPEGGKYRFNGPCCGSGLNWALFSGGSFGQENEMLAATGAAEVEVTAGTSYWISVYGTPRMGATEPWMQSFSFLITGNLSPLPPRASVSGSTPDTSPPRTTLDRSRLRAAARSAKFWFSASEAVQGFQCQLDKSVYKPCGSPRTYRRLKAGRHAFRVKAVDLAGNIGAPAVAHFKVPKPYHGRR